MMNIYNKYKEIINYLIFGVLTTLLSLLVYYLSTFLFLNPNNNFELQIANIISWCVGVLFAYVTNRKYVFESHKKSKKQEFFSFVSSRITTLLLDMLIMFLFVSVLKYSDKLFKLISQVVVIVGNYLLSKLIVFRKSSYETKKQKFK